MNQLVRQLVAEAPPRECGVRGDYYFWWNTPAMMQEATFPGEVLGNDLRSRGEFKGWGFMPNPFPQGCCMHSCAAGFHTQPLHITGDKLVPRPLTFI